MSLATVLSASALCAVGAASANLRNAAVAQCQAVEVVQNFNLTEFIRATWFIQKQQVNGFQPLESLNCVVATYNETFQGEASSVPLFKGNVITVFNDCNKGGKNVNVSNNYTDPEFKPSFAAPLCARQTNAKEPAKLSVAPCRLPNVFAGDYWVVEAGPQPDDYQWAIVVAGQPKVQLEDGCTTPDTCSGPAQTNCGLWLFTRESMPGSAALDALLAKASANGISTQLLKDIDHSGCTYDGMAIKPNVRASANIV